MKKVYVILILSLLLVGSIAFVSSYHDGNASPEENNTDLNESDGEDNDECTVDVDCNNNKSCISGKCKEVEEKEKQTTMTKIKIRGNRTASFVPWQKRNESECLDGCKCVGAVVSCPTETGKTMTIEAGRSGNIIIITIIKGQDDNDTNETEDEEDIEAETELELEQEETENNKTKIKVKLSNGRKAEIKIMPDAASEKALERLGLKVCSSENNCTIELKETGEDSDIRASYEVQVERHMRILALFRAKAQVKAQIDAETGEVIIVKKPWWAFLALEPEE